MNRKTIPSLIAFSAVTAFAFHAVNRVCFSTSTLKNVLKEDDSNYFEWRFGKIKYTKRGTGSPLLLIHDLIVGSSGYEYRKIVDDLSKDHELYVLDLLGYGLSDKPNMTYTNYLYVQLILDFIKNVIGEKTDIVASGDSSSIAIMACHNDPESIRNVILLNPQSLSRMNLSPNRQTRLMKFILDLPVLGTFIYNMMTTKESFRKNFREELFYNRHSISEEMIAAYSEASHYPDYNAKYSYTSYVGRYMNTGMIHALKEINHCIYIVYGKGQREIESITDHYIYFNSAVEKVGIEDSGHFPHIEKPDATLQQLRIFL
ncbi:MAG TPA: alpha/beta fold hydrolase [Candidatus Eisenbergiella pullicola]|nr:alpha/beta fold hydrolase [Candidatus Eisenbergiella pullicola]